MIKPYFSYNFNQESTPSLNRQVKVFCELEFLIEFARKFYSKSDLDEGSEYLLLQFMRFLGTVTLFLLDIDKEEYDGIVMPENNRLKCVATENTLNVIEDNTVHLKKKIVSDLYRKCISKGRRICINYEYKSVKSLLISNTEDSHLFNAIFFTSQDRRECEMLSEKYGVLVFNIDMILEPSYEDYYKNHKETVNAGNGWGDTKVRVPKCNSLIIADRYLYDNYCKNKRFWSTSFEALIKKMCPTRSINYPFHITLCSQRSNRSNFSEDDICNTVKNIVSRLSGGAVEPIVDVLSFGQSLHDRTLITNNFYMDVGVGFTLPNQCRSSLSGFCPMMCSDIVSRDEYYNLITEIYNVLMRNGQIHSDDMINRIFDFND